MVAASSTSQRFPIPLCAVKKNKYIFFKKENLQGTASEPCHYLQGRLSGAQGAQTAHAPTRYIYQSRPGT